METYLRTLFALAAQWATGLVFFGLAYGQVSPSQPGNPQDGAFGGRGEGAAQAGAAVLNLDSGLAFSSIQAAIDAASPGDTLEVQVAELLEGQVLVDRDLTIQGQSSRGVAQNRIRMAVDTGASGDDRAWFLVSSGVSLQVQNLTFDGNGRLVWQAFRHRGSGSFINCRFVDIQFNASGPHYAGTAIAAFDFGGNVDVLNCNFEQIGRIGVLLFGAGTTGLIRNNRYQGKGDGNFLDYAFETGAGASSQMVNNFVSHCQGQANDGSTSAGILITTFFGAGTVAEVRGNALTSNTSGISIGLGGDSSQVQTSFNRIFGNTSQGLSTSSSVAIGAENNWWGCNGGPLDNQCDQISLESGAPPVGFDPWLVLTLEAPSTLVRLEEATITASVTKNSNGNDTKAQGHLPDGTSIGFHAGGLGSIFPPLENTMGGTANAVFVAEGLGNGNLEARLDNQTATASIAIIRPEVPVPTLNFGGLAALMLFLTAAGVLLVRKNNIYEQPLE